MGDRVSFRLDPATTTASKARRSPTESVATASGFVGSDGFASTQVGVSDIDASDGFQTECVFFVWPQQRTNVADTLKRTMEKEGLSAAELALQPRFQKLLEERKQEKLANGRSRTEAQGKPVVFGGLVQLQHSVSLKYLSVTRKVSEQNKEGRSVLLDRDAGEAAWFVLEPHLKVHAEGLPIHTGDPIVLRNVLTDRKLHVEAGKIAKSDRFEGARDVTAAQPPRGRLVVHATWPPRDHRATAA